MDVSVSVKEFVLSLSPYILSVYKTFDIQRNTSIFTTINPPFNVEQEYSTIGFRFGAEAEDGGRKEECKLELETKAAKVSEDFTITEKTPARAFS